MSDLSVREPKPLSASAKQHINDILLGMEIRRDYRERREMGLTDVYAFEADRCRMWDDNRHVVASTMFDYMQNFDDSVCPVYKRQV